MLCGLEELGLTQGDFPYAILDGIFIIEEECTIGQNINEIIGNDDTIVEFEITNNRPDCYSVIGLARESAAAFGMAMKHHEPVVKGSNAGSIFEHLDVEVPAEHLCNRYSSRMVANVKIGPSPKWLRQRLRANGVRPINNIVDITNYIMMAYGQPLHCFDADMIQGGKVVVKTMPEGTPFVTLDGVEHKLSERDLAICNAEEPMCIAGVFGGKGSGTYDTTCNVLLESAYFNPTWIRKSSRRHALQTDASFRFERGIDPNGQIYALKQAAIMAKELAGAKVSMQIVDVQSQVVEPFSIDLKYAYVNTLIGKDIPAETVKSIVTSLEMEIVKEDAEGILLSVPAYRVDVQRPCDVVEDILRIYGYNNIEIPSTVKSSLSVKGEADKSHKLQNLIAEQLVGCGFHEILNNSLQKISYYTSGAQQTYKEENCVRLLNPLSQDLSVLRQSLLFGGLESIARNSAHRMPDQRMFEFGNCYRYDEARKCADIIPGVSSSRDPEVIKHVLDAYSEEMHMGLWVTGKRVSGNWAHANEDSTFAELKAYVMNIISRLGVPFGMLVFADGAEDIFDKSLEIRNRGGKVLVKMGIVSRKVLKAFDIENPVFFADLDWKLLMKTIRNQAVKYTEISKFPAVSRDLALLIDQNVEFASIEQIAYQTEKKLLKAVTLFDVYEGKNLPAGKKSYAVNFILQDTEKTMSEKAIDAIMQKLIQQLTKQLGAELR
jgi:phenylalanyl-tRNA synthetase beta chain